MLLTENVGGVVNGIFDSDDAGTVDELAVLVVDGEVDDEEKLCSRIGSGGERSEERASLLLELLLLAVTIAEAAAIVSVQQWGWR